MVKLLYISLISFLSFILVACNGGGSPTPDAKIKYGKLINWQQLNTDSSLAHLAKNYAYSWIGQDYQESSPPAIANIKNLGKLYNFAANTNSSIMALEDFIQASAAKVNVIGIEAYAISYNTPGVLPKSVTADISRIVSGLVVIPKLAVGHKLRGVVIYYHATTFAKNNVPSCIKEAGNSLGAYCFKAPLAADNDKTFYQIAATYAARGLIVVAPDYVGQGIDLQGIHPYVAYPENNAQAGLYMLPALKVLLAQRNIVYDESLPLFITGYSEGGAYALKASELAQTKFAGMLGGLNIHLAVTAPAEGAYALNSQMQFAFANLADGLFNGNLAESEMMNDDFSDVIDGVKQQNSWNIVWAPAAAISKPALLAYVIEAIIYYDFQNNVEAYSSILNSSFWQNIQVQGSRKLFNLYELFTDPNLTKDQISNALIEQAFMINDFDRTSSPKINLFAYSQYLFPLQLPSSHYGENNSALAFVNQSATNTDQFKQIIQNGTTYQWTTHSPINFINLKYDSVVTVHNFDIAYQHMHDLAPEYVESTPIANFQLTNDLAQYFPNGILGEKAVAVSKFFAPSPILKAISQKYSSRAGQPIDHSDAISSAIANIIALCSFENSLANKPISGRCPDF